MMDDSRSLYLDLMARCLIGTIYEDPSQDPWSEPVFAAERRRGGLDWPLKAHSMIGELRMNNVRTAVEHVLKYDVPGDLIETGVWRGGTTIFMRAILKAYGVTDRLVWVADSFEGLPPPDPEYYPVDEGDVHNTFVELAVSLEEVKSNFDKYGLLDDQVRFLKGWFKDTLPVAPIERLAVLRLDGDMYQSTMETFEALYDKVPPGGVVIVDDYGAVAACKQAVHDFRSNHGVFDTVKDIDGIGVYWIKSA
nr:TylF/MycF family methyltransferase [Azospirillum argentinense]